MTKAQERVIRATLKFVERAHMNEAAGNMDCEGPYWIVRAKWRAAQELRLACTALTRPPKRAMGKR